jgi:two-component system chemotaxis sensor kinase CheA
MAKDPYRYFRVEARELVDGLGKATLELEKGGGERSLVDHLLRMAHTLKGAARVVKEAAIAERSHAIEELLAPHRLAESPIAATTVADLLAAVDAIASRLSALEAPVPESTRSRPVAPAAQRRAHDESFDSVRVAIAEMDNVLHGVTEALVQLTRLRREVAAVDTLRRMARDLAEGVHPLDERSGLGRLASELGAALERHQHQLRTGIDAVDGEVTQLRDSANQLRLLPASMLFPVLERAVRDAADTLGKPVELVVSGGEQRLDAHVLAKLREALVHVTRNAVAHGIEPAARRAALGKPPVGRITLAVERRQNRVAFVCSDDGAGIDVEGVRAGAVRAGRLTAAEADALGAGDVTRLVLGAGVSTRRTADAISGRGVGLDVLADTVVHLKGEVKVHSEPGRGARFEIVVPVSLSVVRSLEIDAGGIVALVPLDAIRETLRVSADEVAHGADGDALVFEGRAIPFIHAARALGGEAAPRPVWPAIVLESPAGRAAVAVDRLLGISDVVVRPLPSFLEAEPVVTGAALGAEGQPLLFLDPDGLVVAARQARRAQPEIAAPKRRRILIIDDSLTTRMLEQNILESAGYDVELATSAEEGLSKAHAATYGLFLVDVEMPGMDGFEFVERARADTDLGHVPAILVTSRGDVEDRRRGQRAGARGYIVKGEFDQDVLLSMIRELLG